MKEVPSEGYPYQEEETAPTTKEELEEAKKEAFVTDEFGAALRGLEFALQRKDEALFNGFKTLINERFGPWAVERSASGDFSAVAESAEGIKILIEKGKQEFNIGPQTEKIIEQKLDELNEISPKDLANLLTEAFGNQSAVEQDDLNLIRGLAEKYIRNTSGKISTENSLKKAHQDRYAAKTSHKNIGKFRVIDNHSVVYQADTVQELMENITGPARK